VLQFVCDLPQIHEMLRRDVLSFVDGLQSEAEERIQSGPRPEGV